MRDPERWYESSMATIFGVRARADESPLARTAMRLIGIMIPGMRQGFQVVDDVIWEGTFGGRFADRAHALSVFAEHNREVQTTVPADRLLVFDVKQGWEPLCTFLGVPVPEGELFPHVNDAESFQQRMQERFARELLERAWPIAAAVAAMGALFWIAWRARRRETV